MTDPVTWNDEEVQKLQSLGWTLGECKVCGSSAGAILQSPEDAEKIKIYDWLFTPTQDRPDRDPKIDRKIHRNQLTALMVFRTWGTEAEVRAAILNLINDAANV